MINLTVENMVTIGTGIVMIALSFSYVKNTAERNKRELEEVKNETKRACANIRDLQLQIAKNCKSV